ncbi:replicative helicase loader/inhibitor [Bacillaceae bacterium S4-13-58]
MTHDEAIKVLKTIREFYPKYDISREKAKILIPQLQRMDYTIVLKNLSEFVVKNHYPPTIGEIAGFPPEENPHIEYAKQWRIEAAQVTQETKKSFHQKLQQLFQKMARP